jgi:hypothetical protein
MTGKEPLPPLENLTAAWLVLRIISPTPSLLPSAGGSEDGCGEGAQCSAGGSEDGCGEGAQ